MIYIDVFITSYNAARVPRIVNTKGKWLSRFHITAHELKVLSQYIWKMSFRKVESFAAIKVFTLFYQEVILSFNKAKYITPIDK